MNAQTPADAVEPRLPATPPKLGTSPLHHALQLGEAGIAVFACDGLKRPLTPNGFYDATTDPKEICKQFANPAAKLVGVRTGQASRLFALDQDPAGVPWYVEHQAKMPRTRTHRTQRGGNHLFFRWREGLGCTAGKIAPGIDTRGEGGYVIHWPSAGIPIYDDAPIADLPDWLFDTIISAQGRARTASGEVKSPEALAPPDAATLIALLARIPNPLEVDRDTYTALNLSVQGAIRGGIATGRMTFEDGEDAKDGAALWSSKWEGATAQSFEEERERWERDWSIRVNDFSGYLEVLDIAAELGVDVRKESAATLAAVFPDDSGPETAEEIAENAAIVEANNWRSKLQCTEKGVPRGNLLNAQIALASGPGFKGVFRLDTFANNVVVKSPPWARAKSRPLLDSDAAHAAVWLQTQGIQVRPDTAHQAILLVSESASYDPVLDYLKGLEWDGTPRIDTWVVDYLGAENDDKDYVRQVSAKSLIAAVARAVAPGCKVDTVLVLEGPQGLGKSSVVRTLFGEWFADHLPDLSSKDAMVQLAGRWCIELAELATLDRAEAARIKAFISSAEDVFRPPYGRTTETRPRRCVLWGTVNPGATGYLRDETGARRFWPIKCGVDWAEGRQIDVKGIARVRDQLWAEAYSRFRENETWWLVGAASEARQAEIASERFADDPWTETVHAYLAEQPDGVSMSALLEAVARGVAVQNKADATRIGGIVLRAGWEKRRATGGNRSYAYFRGPKAEPMSPATGDAAMDELLR